MSDFVFGGGDKVTDEGMIGQDSNQFTDLVNSMRAKKLNDEDKAEILGALNEIRTGLKEWTAISQDEIMSKNQARIGLDKVRAWVERNG